MNKKELLKWIDERLEVEERFGGYTPSGKSTKGYCHALKKVREKMEEGVII